MRGRNRDNFTINSTVPCPLTFKGRVKGALKVLVPVDIAGQLFDILQDIFEEVVDLIPAGLIRKTFIEYSIKLFPAFFVPRRHGVYTPFVIENIKGPEERCP